jgi:hypothetical protein
VVLTMKARVIVPGVPTAVVSAGKAGRERGPSQTPPAFALVLNDEEARPLLRPAWGWQGGARAYRLVGQDSRASGARMIVRRLPTGGPWFAALALADEPRKSLTRTSGRLARDDEWPNESGDPCRRWTGKLTLQPTTLCHLTQPRRRLLRNRGTGTMSCLPSSGSKLALSISPCSTVPYAGQLLNWSKGIPTGRTTRFAKSFSAWVPAASLCTRRSVTGEPRKASHRGWNAGTGESDPQRSGSETGGRRRVGWSSAVRNRFVRHVALGIGAGSVGADSRPRCSNRTLLRLAGLSELQFSKESPPASGGPVNTTLTDRHDRKAELVRHGIRRTRPNDRSHDTRTEIVGHIVFQESSIPCARQTATISIGDQSHQATAGAKGIKGASAHLRCGSMVSGVGSAALKGSGGTAAFGRAARLGCGLAHPGDGFFAHHGAYVKATPFETTRLASFERATRARRRA